MTEQPLRVCYFGTYRKEYARNIIMIDGLRANGVEVVECHATLWRSFEDRERVAAGGWVEPRFWWRVLRAYASALYRYWRTGGDYDVLVVGYLGQFDVFVARLLSWLHHKPLVWDIFMSIALIAEERKLQHRKLPVVRLIRGAERLACTVPDRLIIDTDAYVHWFCRSYGLNPQRFRLVPTGADDRIFQWTARQPQPGAPFTVVYYGTFIPNHGVEYIIEAARLLRDDPGIHFECIGNGPDKPRARALARQYGLSNVTFVRWLKQPDLVARLAQADVSLGAFGTTPQSLMTVHNKIYEGLAMGIPIITGESRAVCEALQHGEHISICKRADPASLAAAITALRDDPQLRQRLARQGHQYYQEGFTVQRIGARFKQHLQQVARGKS